MRTAARVPLALVVATAFLVVPLSSADPQQHGDPDGHLTGSGAWGDLELVSTLRLTEQPSAVADVAVDPTGSFAYVAQWAPSGCPVAGSRGDKSQGGVWIVDIRDLSNPRQIGFIPQSRESRPGEGIQVLDFSTRFFTGQVLVTNNEPCGPRGQGGITLWDVTNPHRPRHLADHSGERTGSLVHPIHSAFAWIAGDKAYAVVVDNVDASDVDILDITNPRRPVLVAEYNVNTLFGPVAQPEIGLTDSFLHDVTVKQIDGNWIMLLSYWDGGFVKLDVTNPAQATFLGDTDYPLIDPELFESTGTALTPEGNAHQAEWTADNRFIIGTDEDFNPTRPLFTIKTGADAGEYPSDEFSFTPQVLHALPDGVLNGPTVYGGYGCPADRGNIPAASHVSGPLAPGEETVIVFQRGPLNDPARADGACLFSEKIESAQLAGYDAVIIANHHTGAQTSGEDAPYCGSQGHEFEIHIPAICIGHRAMHLLFASEPAYDNPYQSGTEPTIGTLGEDVEFRRLFDGWGYVHLFDAETLEELDTYAVPEAMDPSMSVGFGDLSVHEVATDPHEADFAYLAYYAAGIRVLNIQCSPWCQLVETGGYLDPNGNNFWGIEAFRSAGRAIIVASDRDSGIWIFERT